MARNLPPARSPSASAGGGTQLRPSACGFSTSAGFPIASAQALPCRGRRAPPAGSARPGPVAPVPPANDAGPCAGAEQGRAGTVGLLQCNQKF